MRVGVISDTHGLLRPEAIAALRGSDLIVHAGDIERRDVLEQLRDLAPTYAVRGNIDVQPVAAVVRLLTPYDVWKPGYFRPLISVPYRSYKKRQF